MQEFQADDVQSANESDVLRCLPGVRALILRMTRDIPLTNDLTQEVMIAVIVAVREGRLRQGHALISYTHQTAKHMVYASRRRQQPIPMETSSEQESMWSDAPRTPLEFCEADELRRLSLEVLDELPMPRDRALIIGFYVDGRSKNELMGQLKLDADHFDRVMFRARSRMRERIRAKMNERQLRTVEPHESSIHSGAKGSI